MRGEYPTGSSERSGMLRRVPPRSMWMNTDLSLGAPLFLVKRVKKLWSKFCYVCNTGYELMTTRKDWWDRNDQLYLSITAVTHFKRELDQTPYRALPWIPCGSGIFWSFTGKRLPKKTIDEVSFKGCWKPATHRPIGQTGFTTDPPLPERDSPHLSLIKGEKGEFA
jgi:hypothetical protein